MEKTTVVGVMLTEVNTMLFKMSQLLVEVGTPGLFIDYSTTSSWKSHMHKSYDKCHSSSVYYAKLSDTASAADYADHIDSELAQSSLVTDAVKPNALMPQTSISWIRSACNAK